MSESAPLSLHQRIVSELETRILSGAWPPGQRIPSEAELVAHYDCSRMTVNKAIAQLVRAGLVARKRRAGSFVLRPGARSAVLELRDIKSEVEALGLTHSHTILQRKTRNATRADVATLGVPLAAPLLGLLTLHCANDKPFCHESRTINVEAVPHVNDADFASETPGSWLVHHVPWTDAEHRIRAAKTAPQVSTHLGIESGDPGLVVERRTWLRGQPVTHVVFTYPAAGHELVARFSPSAED
jgi:GntR family transcriptional regulator, histidine utilization repressor